jgi:uncharacterized membrane protein
MKLLNRETMLGASIGLLAVQFLVPAFIPMSEMQQAAVSGFCQAVGALLGIRGLYVNPDGTPAKEAYKP